VTELNTLEIEFLKLNSFNLTVPISELQKYGDQLLKVGYIQQQQQQQTPRHSRSSSFDTSRLIEVCDLTQRMSLDERANSQQKHHFYHQKRNSTNNQPVRKMTSTNSLKDNRNGGGSQQQYYNTSNGYYQQQEQQQKQPRHSRSSINLYQGFWKPNSPLQQQAVNDTKQEQVKPTTTSRRLSITSIHAQPFIPSSELQQQIQQQSVYYHYNGSNGSSADGIPTPPPSASPVSFSSSSSSFHHPSSHQQFTTYYS
jgi:hypothetical protein